MSNFFSKVIGLFKGEGQFFSKLSQNYIELLEDDEYYDVTIEVGEGPNVKFFRAHMNILCCRSPYLRRYLASNGRNNNNTLAHIRLPNISPEIFPIILKYIYGGVLSLSEQGALGILNVLLAADALCLQEMIDYSQKYLIKNKSEWMEEHFDVVLQRISLQSNNLLKLKQFYTNFISKFPEKIFKSPNYISLPEEYLVQLIKRDDLQMKEIEIWEYVLKWGLARNPTLIPDPGTWSDDDFKTMRNTIQHCLPSIRFFCLSSVEFSQKVRPYKKIFDDQLYEDLLNSYLDPDSVLTGKISPPRNIKTDGIIDSKIVSNLGIISTISRWTDKMDINNFNNLRELYLPYKFELLLRGSRDGFTPKRFHELCGNKVNTVTFIKVKGTEEILGGYNPIGWLSSDVWGKTKDSFIFSFKNKNTYFKDAILSNVKDTNCAINNHPERGPCFGKDLMLYASKGSGTDIDVTFCVKPRKYEKRIREDARFSMEDYEVFQIIKRC